MKDLQAIARYMRLPEDQLKFPIELLNQGYEPNYLANYRPDELGNIDEQTLSILRRAQNYSESLKAHKEKVQQTLDREQQWNETVASVVSQANTISQVDTVTRHLRARKNSRTISEKCPQVETVGQAILTMQGDAPKDLLPWIAEVASVPLEQAADVLEQTKRWMVFLLSEDVRLMQELQRSLLRKAGISVKVLPDPPKGSDAEKQLERAEANAPSQPVVAPVLSAAEPTSAATAGMESVVPADSSEQPADSSEQTVTPIESPSVSIESAEPASSAPEASDVVSEQVEATAIEASSIAPDAVSPLIAEFHQGRKQGKGIKTKTLSDKQLSPRQRRRKWLRSILESYAKLKKPLTALTPYQILMLSRGQRSQIVSLQFHYDERPLVQACRESLCPGRHPMHHWLLEVAEDGLRNHILPRLHQDVLSILEEDAHTDLTEAAVVHLQASLLQRPVHGHRILIIDAIGPKMAAVAIVDADGKVVFTNEIPCNSNRADVVAQNVVSLGQWIHEHKVTLMAISNGPARRYLIHTVSELLKQSSEGSLYWTMVDRAGADAYCMSRGCLVELPNISRRHRAAVWLALRLQDPLKQILKVDPVRLRLGSYQRELPQRELEAALQDAVSTAITQAGVDVFHADTDVLKRIPGMSTEAAKAVVKACHDDKIVNREALMTVLREHLTEMQARQAIGFIKVFGSTEPLDGTTIHPDDYRLAERLVAHASLALPASCPANWNKPDYAQLAVATAAAIVEHAKQVETQPFGESIDLSEPSRDESAESDASAESEVDMTPPTDAEIESTDAGTAAGETADASNEVPINEPPTTDAAPEITVETPAAESASESVEASPAQPPRIMVPMPPIPSGPMERPTHTIDVERLARSWQVGREKMKRVANCLQFAFTDSRDFQYPIPLLSKVPKLDALQSGTMLQALVIGVADFGVFVDLGPECSGLIHISRLAPDFIEDPHQFVQVGDLVPVWVLNVDEKKKRVSLTAIPPGTPSRRDAQNQEGSQDRGGNVGRDNRNQRNDRNQGSREGRPPAAENRSPMPAGAGNDRGRGPGGGNRPSGGGNRPGGDSRGGDNRGGRPTGRDNNRDRDRNRGNSRNEDQGTRRPARVEPPKPVTPITDAMQTGKEPLRSFSDLLQFMKKEKDEPVVVRQEVEKVVPQKPETTESAPTPAEPSSESVANRVDSTQSGDASDTSA
ncbi:MAG: S1 RNA-binding domain-containing protein [Planctomycetota bacterium]|nr:S1 RNA-binding domain-containing protein [Planctomycetota bacterium]